LKISSKQVFKKDKMSERSKRFQVFGGAIKKVPTGIKRESKSHDTKLKSSHNVQFSESGQIDMDFLSIWSTEVCECNANGL
jgi:hypothetical protein